LSRFQIEGTAVFAVAVADQEADAPIAEVETEVACCWVTQAPVGFAVQPASQTLRLSWEMKNNT
jgi:hypothetical protein